jgi:uncharacterized membrane protein
LSLRYLLALIGTPALSIILVAAAMININPTIIGTLSLLELIWIVENGIGLLYSQRNLKDSWAEYKKVQAVQQVDPLELIVARNSRRVDLIVTTKQLLYLSIGLLSAAAPPPLRIPNQGLANIVAVMVFILGSGLLSYLSYSTRRDREDARASWDRRHSRERMRKRSRTRRLRLFRWKRKEEPRKEEDDDGFL